MHGAVLLDAADEVLRPAILWNDQRTARECDLIRAAVGPQRLIEITGNDALTGFTAPKLVWVRDNEPDIWARTRHVLLPKDYLRLRLTGEHAMDKADGSGTILFDLAARDWSDEVLAALHIDRALMPPTFEGPAVTGTLTADAAAATGLRAGTPVVAGGGDQSANAVGVGAVAPGVVALSLGTSGVVFAATDAPLYEPHGRVHAFCHAVPGRWHMMRVMLSAAGSLRWFRDALAPGVDFGDLVAPAADVEAAGSGLYFLPYLTGERSPHPDPDARGAFIGLDVTHDRRHMTRAVLEGVSFGLRDGLELMVEAGMPRPTQIRASGGGLASPLWRQILADILDAEIDVRAPLRARHTAQPCSRPSARAGSDRSTRRPLKSGGVSMSSLLITKAHLLDPGRRRTLGCVVAGDRRRADRRDGHRTRTGISQGTPGSSTQPGPR